MSFRLPCICNLKSISVPISFSPPVSGGTYFTCIAYEEGVVFQLKLLFCAESTPKEPRDSVGIVRGKKL